MKKQLAILGFIFLLFTQSLYAKEAWISDEIKAPLRTLPETSSKIISMLSAGQKIETLSSRGRYVKIRTADGKTGWLSKFYVLNRQSLHEKMTLVEKDLTEKITQLSTLNKELEEKTLLIKHAGIKAGEGKKIITNSRLLQDKLIEQNRRITQLVKALESEKQRTLDARTQYVSLAKVSQDAVDINKQNKVLQEKNVAYEKKIQQLNAENQSLQGQIGKKDFIVGVLTVLAGILVGYILSVIMPPGTRHKSSYNNL